MDSVKPSSVERDDLSRRGVLGGGLAAGVGAALGVCGAGRSAEAQAVTGGGGLGVGSGKGYSFDYCLNASTVRGQRLDLRQQVELVIGAGYDGFEPWINDVQAYRDAGGSLADINKMCVDGGVTVASAIGFAQWIVDDDAARAAGLEQMKRDMALLRTIGGIRIAAPPVGAHQAGAAKIDLDAAAERYAAVCSVGRDEGVLPQLEVWGFSANLSKLGESMYVATASGDRDACLLADVYHMFKGGSAFEGLKFLSSRSTHCFHMNDYPGGISSADATDADRVYPGDGVAPLGDILRMFAENGCRLTLSLELFNRGYWEQPAEEVAATGLAKMKASVAGAGL